MKKLLAIVTMIAFCLVALNLQAIDKTNKKNKKKVKAKKELRSAAKVVKSEFKGTKAVYLKTTNKNAAKK